MPRLAARRRGAFIDMKLPPRRVSTPSSAAHAHRLYVSQRRRRFAPISTSARPLKPPRSYDERKTPLTARLRDYLILMRVDGRMRGIYSATPHDAASAVGSPRLPGRDSELSGALVTASCTAPFLLPPAARRLTFDIEALNTAVLFLFSSIAECRRELGQYGISVDILA